MVCVKVEEVVFDSQHIENYSQFAIRNHLIRSLAIPVSTKSWVILFLFLSVLSWYTESHHGIQINSLYWNHLKVIKNQIIISKCFIFVKTLFLYVAVTIRFTNKNSSAMSACVIFFFSCFL